MSTKHTPGPWAAYKTNYEGHASGAWYIHARNGPDARSRSVAHIKQSTIHPMEANARLIAAAPEMLELLRELVDIEGPQPGTAEWSKKAHAAIAKATGSAL